LTASLKPFDPGFQAPVLTLADFALSFTVAEAEVTPQTVRLVQTPASTTDLPVESISVTRNNISIAASVYRPRWKLTPGRSAFGGFKETRIQGLTSQPMLLQGYYSQTRRVQCGAHNCWDEFLFEPQLEPR